jgi:hypothetical protein
MGASVVVREIQVSFLKTRLTENYLIKRECDFLDHFCASSGLYGF